MEETQQAALHTPFCLLQKLPFSMEKTMACEMAAASTGENTEVTVSLGSHLWALPGEGVAAAAASHDLLPT